MIPVRRWNPGGAWMWSIKYRLWACLCAVPSGSVRRKCWRAVRRKPHSSIRTSSRSIHGPPARLGRPHEASGVPVPTCRTNTSREQNPIRTPQPRHRARYRGLERAAGTARSRPAVEARAVDQLDVAASSRLSTESGREGGSEQEQLGPSDLDSECAASFLHCAEVRIRQSSTAPHHARFASYQATVSRSPRSRRTDGRHPSSVLARLKSMA